MPIQETLAPLALTEIPTQELAEISFVVPVVERYDDLVELYGSFSREARKITQRYEFVFVLDGGFEQAYQVVKSLRATDPRVRVVRLQGQSGRIDCFNGGF